PVHALVADCIAADRLAGLDAKQIAQLPVVHGGRPGALGDFFKVRGGRSSVVRIEGDLPQVEAIGASMAGGELTIDGSVGRDVGIAMSGGRIDVRGHAGDNAGGARAGAARGMTGGEIIVRGNVGDEAGARMRRGILAVTGDGGRGTGIGMIAGTGGGVSGTGGTLRWSERACQSADAMAANAEALRVAVQPLPGGARVIDAGVEAWGGFGAGRALAEICTAGLADIAYPPVPIGG